MLCGHNFDHVFWIIWHTSIRQTLLNFQLSTQNSYHVETNTKYYNISKCSSPNDDNVFIVWVWSQTAFANSECLIKAIAVHTGLGTREH